MTIVAILVAVVLAFLAFRFVTGMIKFGVMTAPHRCFGAFVDSGRTAAAQLEAVMSGLGFASPITNRSIGP